jgi:hypothetical protein
MSRKVIAVNGSNLPPLILLDIGEIPFSSAADRRQRASSRRPEPVNGLRNFPVESAERIRVVKHEIIRSRSRARHRGGVGHARPPNRQLPVQVSTGVPGDPEPRNPNVVLTPAPTEPLCAALRAVTVEPWLVTEAFHDWVTVSPFV